MSHSYLEFISASGREHKVPLLRLRIDAAGRIQAITAPETPCFLSADGRRLTIPSFKENWLRTEGTSR